MEHVGDFDSRRAGPVEDKISANRKASIAALQFVPVSAQVGIRTQQTDLVDEAV